MSVKTGTFIKCDHHPCGIQVFGRTVEEAERFAQEGRWSRTADGRDFCGWHTDQRAKRAPLRSLVPDGVTLRRAWGAAEAVGWEKRVDEKDENLAHFFCCGQEVQADSILGSAYQAKCKVCDRAIADVTGPVFGANTVAWPDSDKVDTEDPCSWVVVSEYRAAKDREEG